MPMPMVIPRNSVVEGATSDTFYPEVQVGVITDHVITLTASDIHGMFATPIELLPAPQSGRAWWAQFAYLSHTGANYSGGGGLDLRYGTDPPHTGISQFPRRSLTQTYTAFGGMAIPSGAVDSFSGIRNAPIILANANAPFTGAGGDVTITLRTVLVDMHGHRVATFGNVIPRNNVIQGAVNDKYDPLGRAARFYISTTTVSEAQFVLLRNQPVELLPTPPPGTWYQVEGILVEKTSNTPYGAGNAIRVRYIGNHDVAGWFVTVFRSTAVTSWSGPSSPGGTPDSIPVVTSGLEVYNVSTDFAGNGGPITFSTVYCLVDT